MTAAADREPKPPKSVATDKASLIEANVNPATGFATDYLNHFNEAVMLLELMAEMPECREDFFAWQPKNYAEHFAASKSRHRDVAIAAYAEADPALRQRLDSIADSMNEILLATREVMQREFSPAATAQIADLAARWVRPLVARAGAVINGTDDENDTADAGVAPQDAIDALMAR